MQLFKHLLQNMGFPDQTSEFGFNLFPYHLKNLNTKNYYFINVYAFIEIISCLKENGKFYYIILTIE